MPLSTRLAELQKRHENLEDELEAAKIHPSIDTLDLVSLKEKIETERRDQPDYDKITCCIKQLFLCQKFKGRDSAPFFCGTKRARLGCRNISGASKLCSRHKKHHHQHPPSFKKRKRC